MRHLFVLLISILFTSSLMAQFHVLTGQIKGATDAPVYANIQVVGQSISTQSDSAGFFALTSLPHGTHTLHITAVGHQRLEKKIHTSSKDTLQVAFALLPESKMMHEIVVSGTMKEMTRQDSPVPVEVYTAAYFKANPTPSLFDALQNINGVRPQLNCNICNTGDIHINGLEGPYTMVLIDGMPIVSGLSTVYGLSGIPQSLIERVEIVKGPASTLYGSEAVGGLINIITQKPSKAPKFSADIFGTTWSEWNADVAGSFKLGSKAHSLVGVNYFNYQHPVDRNGDGFTDVTLQNRISLFNKWQFNRKQNRLFSLAGRYIYEDRWGGDMKWNPTFRGGDSIYAESIYTRRWETFGTYQLPFTEKIMLSFSANGHDQNSVYGDIPYLAKQYIGFGELNWNKTMGQHDWLAGAAFRYIYYDDNTPATVINQNGVEINQPSQTYLPGVFIQDEITLNANHKLLAGIRYDYNSLHGNILTPRLNYKWNSNNKNNTLRFSVGNGYRVANIFTEDHAALSGGRVVEFLEDLKPETSWNTNLNFVKKLFTANGGFIGLDASAFYTYFTNKIIADYDTDVQKILYANLGGHAISKGLSLNLDMSLWSGLKILTGGTFMDVYSVQNGQKTRQLFTERFSGVWNISYQLPSWRLTIDYTGNVYSPMRLPLLSPLDPRPDHSPWWSIQNIQATHKLNTGLELYGGIKNLLNWTPAKNIPFLISRAQDPFDKNIQFDGNGQVMATPQNPYALSFDPSYMYAPNQGMRGFLGIRWHLK